MSNHIVRPKTEINRSAAFSASDARTALRELIRGLGHDPELINTDDLQLIADDLVKLVPPNKRGERPDWSWRYLRNVLNQKIDASAALTRAIYALGATTDGLPAIVASAQQVTVLVVGRVHPGALVLADSRKCARPGCPIHFIPRSARQRYCTIECRTKDRKRKK